MYHFGFSTLGLILEGLDRPLGDEVTIVPLVMLINLIPSTS